MHSEKIRWKINNYDYYINLMRIKTFNIYMVKERKRQIDTSIRIIDWIIKFQYFVHFVKYVVKTSTFFFFSYSSIFAIVIDRKN